MLQSGNGCDELTLVIGKGSRKNPVQMPFQPSLSPKSAQLISISFPKIAHRFDVPLLNLRLGILDALVLQLQNTAAVNFAGNPDQGVGLFCLRRQAGEAKHRTKHPDSAKATIQIHQRKYSSPGTRIYFLAIRRWSRSGPQKLVSADLLTLFVAPAR